MANHIFYGKITHEAGTASTDGVVKSQLDTGVADAKARANHTGTQTSSTISDFSTAVDARISNVIAGAPTALDTLNELAAALGNDPNFAATTATALGDLDTRIDALEGASPGSTFKANIGDNTASTFTVTHSLATLDIHTEVVLISSGQTVHPVITRTSTNAISVDFGTTVPGTNAYRVLIRTV
jgi:hypothetical protein